MLLYEIVYYSILFVAVFLMIKTCSQAAESQKGRYLLPSSQEPTERNERLLDLGTVIRAVNSYVAAQKKENAKTDTATLVRIFFKRACESVNKQKQHAEDWIEETKSQIERSYDEYNTEDKIMPTFVIDPWFVEYCKAYLEHKIS